MALNTTLGDPALDSYATLAEANAFFNARPGMDVTDWTDTMEVLEKEYCLKQALLIMDGTFRFRGQKATLDQMSAWPRIFPGDDLWTDGYGEVMSYKDWDTLTEYADLMSIPYPTIPVRVKWAQCEIAFQVVHKYQGSLSAFEVEGEGGISSVGIGGEINLSFSQPTGTKIMDVINKEDVSALSPVRFFLKPYFAGVRGGYV